ncbi:MAG: hypothetical protein M1118_06385 [Chloroflexi bacterium]|nr:hypothetical protein [Chloroflexota bacterium]
MKRPSRVTVVLVIVLALAAAIPRLVLFDQIEFKFDESRVALLALRFVQGEGAPATSILTSGGLHNSPLFVYLMAPALLVSTSPYVLTAWVTMWNVIACIVLFLVLRRATGWQFALIAAALLAIDPLAVHYSRKIWAPELMPPLTVLLLSSLILALAEGRIWWLVGSGVALALLWQLHPAAIPEIFVCGVIVAAFGARWRSQAPQAISAVVLAGLCFVLLGAPFGLYEWRHHFADLLGALYQVSARPALTLEPWRVLWWLVAGWQMKLFFGPLSLQEKLPPVGPSPGDWLVLALLLLGGVEMVRWILQRRTAGQPDLHVVGTVTLALVLLPTLIASRSATPILPHYFVFLLPLLVILLTAGITGLSRDVSRVLQRPTLKLWLRWGLFAGLVGLYLLRDVAFYRSLAVHEAGGDYGIPVSESLQAAQDLRAPNRAPTRAFLASDQGDAKAVFAYLAAAKLSPSVTQFAPQEAVVIPSGTEARYITLDQQTRAVAILEHLGAVPLGGGSPYRILRLPAHSAEVTVLNLDPLLHPAGPFHLEGGAMLLASSVELQPSRRSIAVTLLWEVTNAALASDPPLRIFVHLYDAQRHTLAQADNLGVSNRDLHRGDVLVTWLVAQAKNPLPAGQYPLVAGLYQVQGFHVLQVRGPHDEQLGGEIPLGLVTVP